MSERPIPTPENTPEPNESESYYVEGESPVGQVFIRFPGAKPEIFNQEGDFVTHTNLRRPSIWARANAEDLNKFKAIFKKNRKLGRTVLATAVLGGILLTIGATGYEFKRYHGRHAKTYLKWMKRGLTEIEHRAMHKSSFDNE